MHIIITGAATGIGKELTRLYLKEGHQVAIIVRNPQKAKNNFAADEIAQLHIYEADVCDEDAIRFAIEDFQKKMGSLDLLIANAGISMGVKSRIPNFERARQVFRTNIEGVLNCFQVVIPFMRAQKAGHLAVISSVASLNGLPGTGPYSASKAAVRLWAEALSIDLAADNIQVTSILPGFIKTPLTDVNPHPMPFLISAEQAAKKIQKAIHAKKVTYAFPWQMAIITRFLSILPRSLYIRIMSREKVNYSVKD